MGVHQPTQDLPVQPQDGFGPSDVGLRVGEHLPVELRAADLMRLLRIKKSQFYKLSAIGKFDKFLIKPRIGPRRFSGRLVEDWLNQEGKFASVDLKPRSQPRRQPLTFAKGA